MDFRIFISNIIEQWYYYLPLLIFVISIYLLLFRKVIWGIFDPLWVTVVMMGGATSAVLCLWINNWVDFKFILSFIFTESSLLVGFFIALSIFDNKHCASSICMPVEINRRYLILFSFILNITAVILQFYIFSKVGIGLFRDEVNHVSIYDGLGFLKAFQAGISTVFFICFFLKRKICSLNLLDYISFIVILGAIVFSGSKSGVLKPISIFFIIEYYFYKQNRSKMPHVKWVFLITLSLFPILIIIINDGTNMLQAILLFGARLIGSGDIYVMGYSDDVIRHISANSFWQYLFYPGWGSILKTIGYPITPPTVIGVDIYYYYYNLSNAGPNARLNFLAYYFGGLFWGSWGCFFAGIFIGYCRSIYGRVKHSFFFFFVTTFLYYNIVSIISDLNIFLNDFFWNCAVFFVLYFTTQLVNKGLAIYHE